MGGTSSLPYVSVIIAVRDEEVYIGNLLESLSKQNYPVEKIQFIFVDDGSTDNTYNIVYEKIATDNRFNLIKAGEPSKFFSPKKWALNKGIKIADGEVLIMTDGDCTMEENWVRYMAEFFMKKEIGMVLGSSPLGLSRSIWDRALRMDSIGLDALMMSTLIAKLPFTASGRNLAVRKIAFDEIGGYDSIGQFTSGDDDLLMHAISKSNWRIVPCLKKGSQVESPAPKGWAEFFWQRIRFSSKGKAYFQLDFVNSSFRLGLIFIFVVNLMVFLSQLFFLIYKDFFYLLPWLIKIFSDYLLINVYLSKTKESLDLPFFLFNEVWHALYVTVFGLIGPFFPVYWKGRKSKTDLSNNAY
ncbi:MAG: hypothetical protein CMG75_07075 [Candidatus Marinimicrobia bacterium]|nr:hypothetical protein [Candidatus Neomarinimicrobiota bacterium]MBF89413.1 hypothetical protein [Candidatus Neomarinimicrobiota bacterium]|tara:strand:+ start:499 stop:1563 length:1065 start_codon:yes stop_codon:yes gene_type:complete